VVPPHRHQNRPWERSRIDALPQIPQLIEGLANYSLAKLRRM